MGGLYLEPLRHIICMKRDRGVSHFNASLVRGRSHKTLSIVTAFVFRKMAFEHSVHV